MSDMSPSPPLNRRKPIHRRTGTGGAGDGHHGGRGRDHPQTRQYRQYQSSQTGSAASSSVNIPGNAVGRQGQGQISSAPSSSACSFAVLDDVLANDRVGNNGGGSTSSKNSVGGTSSQEEYSDAEGTSGVGRTNNGGTSSFDGASASGGRRRCRKNRRVTQRSSGDGMSNDEEDDEVDDEIDELVSEFAQDHVLSGGEERAPSVISKRSGAAYADFDGVMELASVDRYQSGALSNNGGAAPMAAMHPLQNAAAVARSHAVGVPHNPLHNWQATKHTLKERFSFMFCNEILADVHFVVGRGDQRQRIPAHRFVLSVGSAVFDAMFNGAMAQSQAEDIDLPDVEPAAFLALLKFLYSDDVQIGPESVMTTLYTAKKYAVPALENACVEFLKRALNADNAFMLLTQARLFDEPHLAALCLEVIDKHTNEALNAEGFTDIDMDTLCAVLERDTLRIREVALYQAVVRWSTEECHRRNMSVTPDNQRALLSRAMQLIRFPLMTVEEFAQTAAQSGILSDRETVNLFLYFTVNPKPSVGFLDIPRCCVTGKEQVVNRFQRIEGRWGYSGTPDRIKFNVDRRIYVVGFGLYGSIHGPVDYQVTIQIIHCGTGKVVGSSETTFQCDGSSNTFRVLFKEPVEICSSVTYIASACLKGPDSHYGTKGLRRVVQQSPNSGCVTFQFTYAAGNNNGTSVEDGQIPEIIYYTKLCA